MASIPAVGSLWQRKPPGKEIVRVAAVWYDPGGWRVSALPVRGGVPLQMDAHEFTTVKFAPVPDEVPA